MPETLTLYKSFDIFEDILPEIRKNLLANAQDIIKENTPYAILDVDKPITPEAIHLHIKYLEIEEKAKPLFQTIRRIDSYRAAKLNPYTQSAGFVTDIDIQNARQVPEDWFIHQAGLSTRRPHKGVCPFHNDTDPSLTLMKSKQSGNFYLKCFACGTHVDSIGYIMARDNVEFMEAVKIVIS